VARAVASVFGVTAEELRQALEEGNFALPGEPEPGSRLLTATEILNEDSLRRRLEDRFDQEVPDIIQQGFEVGLRRMDEFEAEGAFNPQDPIVQNAQRQLNSQATGITDATRRRINEVIRIAQDDPSNSVSDIAEKITEEVEGMGALPQDSGKQSRAQRIAATTTQTGFEAGQMSAMRELGAVGRKWLSTRDERVRPGHLEADSEGQTVRLDEPFMVSPRAGRPQEARERLEFPGDPSGSPANVVNCFTGDVPVSTVGAQKVLRSRFSGKLITVETASGYRVTGTPNHPVLSTSGFIPLSAVDESTCLVTCPTSERLFRNSHLDIQHIEAPFEKVFNAARVVGMPMRVGRMNVDFYGDRPDGDVNVIDINGFLKRGVVSALAEPLSESALSSPDLGLRSLLRFGLFAGKLPLFFIRELAACMVRGIGKFASFLRREVLHPKFVRFARTANVNTILSEAKFNRVPSNVILVREREDRSSVPVFSNDFLNRQVGTSATTFNPSFIQMPVNSFEVTVNTISDFRAAQSRFVETDDVVSVVHEECQNREVYTLETYSGIYNAGGIVSSNCRCTMLPILGEETYQDEQSSEPDLGDLPQL
jgi:hypothetical protein